MHRSVQLGLYIEGMGLPGLKGTATWRKVGHAFTFINLSRKAAKKSTEKKAREMKTRNRNCQEVKIARKYSKWNILKNSINFLAKLRSVRNKTSDMAKVRISLSNEPGKDCSFSLI